MRNTIKPFGKSLGIIALLVVALVFGFAVLVSCETGADGKDGKTAQKVTIDEQGFWLIDGQRYLDENGRYVRAFMRQPEPTDFTFAGEGLTLSQQVNQTYGNVKEIQLFKLNDYVSKGNLTYNYKKIVDGVEDDNFVFTYDAITGAPNSAYYNSTGIRWNDRDGHDIIPRANGQITDANKLVSLDPGTYRIYFSISRDNKYYYEAVNVPIPGDDTVLTVSAAEVKASDFAFINEVIYNGSPVNSDPDHPIVKPNRADLEDETITVTYYPAGSAVLTDLGAPNDVGDYDIRVSLTNSDTAKWYGSLNADGTPVAGVENLLVGTLKILPKYPEADEYVTIPNREAYHPKDGSSADPKLETIIDSVTDIKPDTTPGVIHSDGPRTIVKYFRDATGLYPAYDSAVAPVMPGTYNVTFLVGPPIAPSNKNWNSGEVTLPFTLTIPTVAFSEFQAWLQARPGSSTAPADTSNLFYEVNLTGVDALGGASNTSTDTGSLGKLLKDGSARNVRLDLSDNSFNIVGLEAFNGCTNLYGITLPATVLSIGDYAFNSCTNLEGPVDLSGTVIAGVSGIGDYAFANTKITAVIFPDTLTNGSIGINAFQNCSELSYISIPSDVSLAANSFSSTEFINAYTAGNGGIYQRSPTGSWTRTGDRE